jgi:hypothetical protein
VEGKTEQEAKYNGKGTSSLLPYILLLYLPTVYFILTIKHIFQSGRGRDLKGITLFYYSQQDAIMFCVT